MPSGKGSAAPAPQAAQAAEPPRGCGTPVSERKTETGCYMTAETKLGVLPSGLLFWYLDAYPSRAAAEAARGPRGTVTESFGKHWLFTIAEESWRAASGEKVAIIATTPGRDRQALHGSLYGCGVPAWITARRRRTRSSSSGPGSLVRPDGAQCLETPNGLVMVSAGGTAMVPEGWPMAVSGVGSETRRTSSFSNFMELRSSGLSPSS
jgi:hypothetical protein